MDGVGRCIKKLGDLFSLSLRETYVTRPGPLHETILRAPRHLGSLHGYILFCIHSLYLRRPAFCMSIAKLSWGIRLSLKCIALALPIGACADGVDYRSPSNEYFSANYACSHFSGRGVWPRLKPWLNCLLGRCGSSLAKEVCLGSSV